MNSIIILREEIVCLVVLLYLLYFTTKYKSVRDTMFFWRLCIFAIGHVALDIVTVITVNNLHIVPEPINWGLHLLFYIYALLFAGEFVSYATSLIYSPKIVRRIQFASYVLLLLYVIASGFFEIEYLVGDGTNYSMGIPVYIGYGLAMLYNLVSVVLIIANRKKIERKITAALIPMAIIMVAGMILQIMIPEFLFTGACVTIVTFAMFLALENPTEEMYARAYVDIATGVSNKNCYNDDIVKLQKRIDIMGDKRFSVGVLVCDLNDLKSINDQRGHVEGDRMLAKAAGILRECFISAECIYRIGGDEFVIIFHSPTESQIQSEIEAVKRRCAQEEENGQTALSIAMGYAKTDATCSSLEKVMEIADIRMYADKKKMKEDN